MELVKAAVRFEFAEALGPWLDMRALLRAAEDGGSMELQGEPLVIARAEQGERITLTPRGIAVEVERSKAGKPPTTDRAIEVAGRLAAVTTMPRPAVVRCDNAWIDAFELSGQELVAQLKDRLLALTSLSNVATDMQLVLDEDLGSGITNHSQIGPMQPTQLNRQFLMVARTGLPEQFIFMGLGRTEREPAAFNIDQLRQGSAAFSSWSDGQAMAIAQLVKG